MVGYTLGSFAMSLDKGRGEEIEEEGGGVQPKKYTPPRPPGTHCRALVEQPPKAKKLGPMARFGGRYN